MYHILIRHILKEGEKNILHGFAINKIDEIEIEGDQIVLKGIGYYF